MRKPIFFAYMRKQAQISIIPLLSKSSSHRIWLCSPVCVGPGRKPRFSHDAAQKFLEHLRIHKAFSIYNKMRVLAMNILALDAVADYKKDFRKWQQHLWCF